MRIDSSAPTRIDLAGGTLDIWPLYLFHDNAQTLNAAISLRAHCSIRARQDARVRLLSEDTGTETEAEGWEALDASGTLPLIARLARYFHISGADIVTRSESPFGAGIAGSSALNVAVAGGMAAWTGREIAGEALLAIAMNVEAQVISVPTGAQDYRPAYYGGVSSVKLSIDGVRRVPLALELDALESRLVLAYTKASRNSGINNWDVMKRHIDGDAEVIASFGRIRDIAVAMRDAMEHGDWPEVGRQLQLEWENRKRLAPGVTTPDIDRMIAAAAGAGALGAKVCGAGGGGCLFCFADPADVPAVRSALTANGAQLLPFTLEAQGLRITRS
ncbi:MAG: GHMP kinase [Acidobacteriota bacterium]|nr:GHMP kinase [Acidobacteriota bacterium]